LPANFRKVQKKLMLTNTLAYYDLGFVVHAPVSNYEFFVSVKKNLTKNSKTIFVKKNRN
jgi:hypothetical protein